LLTTHERENHRPPDARHRRQSLSLTGPRFSLQVIYFLFWFPGAMSSHTWHRNAPLCKPPSGESRWRVLKIRDWEYIERE
jgi:hypothetical protein